MRAAILHSAYGWPDASFTAPDSQAAMTDLRFAELAAQINDQAAQFP